MSDRAPTYHLGPDFYERLEKFVEGFLGDGFSAFEKEFWGLDEYIAKAHADTSGSNDIRLRRIAKEKYLLEMVNFFVLDRLNREAFNKAKDTLIVMPDCLTLHNPDCLRIDEKWGDICMRCEPTCQAFEIMDIADRYGLEVVFSKRKLTEQLEYFSEKSGDLSVVGIACINMLAEGMRSAADAGVPARGVLLDFSGCEHWQNPPCASKFQLTRLENILKEKYD